MIKTKTKVKDKTKKTPFSIKGMSKTKKLLLALSFATIGLLSWDMATISTGSIKIEKVISYKANHYSSLVNYDNFKNQINAVPYTDEDFKKDLSMFEAIYGHQDQPVYRKLVDTYMKNKGGIGLSTLMKEKYRHKDLNSKYNQLMAYSKTVKMEDISNQDFSPQVKIILKDNALSEQKLISSGLRLGLYYSIYGPGLSADNKIYSNMERMLQEEGYNKSSFFLSPEFLATRDRSYKENKFEEFKKEQEIIQKQSMDDLMTYYKNGDMKKLKELFRLGHAFSYVMVDDPIDKNIDNFSYAMPVSSIVNDLLKINEDASLISATQYIEKKIGTDTPEKDKYYYNTLGIYY